MRRYAVAHNLIHDLPHAAVVYTGNDHTIEFNEVHNVALDSGDAGAFYTWNDWTSRGHAPPRSAYASIFRSISDMGLKL